MRISDQDQAYKRGLVLGLTMAEIVIIVLFCLLLALATIFVEQRERMEKQVETIRLQETRIAELETTVEVDPADLRLLSELKNYWERYGPQDTSPRQYFSQLILQVEELENLRKHLKQLVERNREEIERNERLEGALTSLREDLREARDKVAANEGHTWPPIIILKEAEGFRFATGDSQLSERFEALLRSEIIPTILDHARQYQVDVIEIVGHTDERPISGRQSNLDIEALPFLRDQAHTVLTAADNAGLGMARAATVARFLLKDGRLANYAVLPLSGAQIMDVGGNLADGSNPGDVPDRRRIEIRLRRAPPLG